MGSSLARAAAKSAVWKVIGITVLVAVSLIEKIDPVKIGKIAILYHTLTLVFYVLHEIVWDRIKWGKKK